MRQKLRSARICLWRPKRSRKPSAARSAVRGRLGLAVANRSPNYMVFLSLSLSYFWTCNDQAGARFEFDSGLYCFSSSFSQGTTQCASICRFGHAPRYMWLRAPSRDLVCARIVPQTHAHRVRRSRTPPLEISLTPSLPLSRFLALPSPLSLSLSLSLPPPLSLPFPISLALALSLSLARSRALSLSLSRARVRARDVARRSVARRSGP